jgi:NADPH:quinone reductase-like Zn-dependent oxidoreductase
MALKLIGQNLMAVCDGILTEYKVFSSQDVIKLPIDSHLSYEEAASLVCTGVTVWNCPYGRGVRLTAE